MSPSEKHKQDRAFLHDLATPLTILKHVLKKLDASKSSEAEQLQKILADALPKAIKALSKLEELHASQKLAISDRESKEEKEAA